MVGCLRTIFAQIETIMYQRSPLYLAIFSPLCFPLPLSQGLSGVTGPQPRP